MDDDQSLQTSLNEYKTQLTVVESALQQSENDKELQELRENLLEVIKLTEDQLLSLKQSAVQAEASENQTQDTWKSEFDRFQEEIAALAKDTGEEEDSLDQEENDPNLDQYLAELEGKRCRAPHAEEWGQLAYHNALIVGANAEGAQGIDGVDVCVMFCNPICASMKPCAFFLEGHCKFSSEKCKFSHGYIVKLNDIQEFKEPDYSLLQRDAFCLAKYRDDLWYNAQVLECLDNNMLKVKYSRYNEDAVLGVEDIFPLDDQPVYCESDATPSV